jgi:hypothetical protein
MNKCFVTLLKFGRPQIAMRTPLKILPTRDLSSLEKIPKSVKMEDREPAEINVVVTRGAVSCVSHLSLTFLRSLMLVRLTTDCITVNRYYR